MLMLKKMQKVCTAALAVVLVAPAALAGPVEDAIKKALEPRMNVPVSAVSKTTLAGLYEVDTPNGLVYTDAKGSFFLVNGIVIETKTGKNLSQERMNQLGAFKFDELPLSDAVKTVRGNGSRVLVTVEDPNCGYCKRLQHELAKVPNITVYTFLVPMLGDDSVVKSKAIWCAPNRSKAWEKFMIEGKPLPTITSCETPLERNAALARKLRAMGTPQILFKSGEREPGFMPAEQIEKRLAAKK